MRFSILIEGYQGAVGQWVCERVGAGLRLGKSYAIIERGARLTSCDVCRRCQDFILPENTMHEGHGGEERFMRMAIDLATENVLSLAGGPFGAVIVRQGQVIATGVNRVTQDHDPTAHAEVCAIREACQVLKTFKLEGCVIYSSCEPCPMCLTAILWARCDGLYFASTAGDAAAAGFDDSHFYAQVRKQFEDRELPTVNFMRDAGNASFAAWCGLPKRVKY